MGKLDAMEAWIEEGNKRRWDVTIFRNQVVDGSVVNVVEAEYHNVRSKWLAPSGLLDYRGVLQFIDENGKEVSTSGIPFVAKEVAASVS